jgi:hypothetical protein
MFPNLSAVIGNVKAGSLRTIPPSLLPTADAVIE